MWKRPCRGLGALINHDIFALQQNVETADIFDGYSSKLNQECGSVIVPLLTRGLPGS